MLRAREHVVAPGLVTDTVYWAIRDEQMVGRIALRHELNESLLREGGHIGYIVRDFGELRPTSRRPLYRSAPARRAER
jgi:predicted acetyltransferase